MSIKIKPYLVFAGDNQYPEAAFGDFKDSFWSEDEAIVFCANLRKVSQYDWVEIVFVEMENK